MAEITHIDEIDSTSTYARKHLGELKDFSTISANHQSKSYGQFERKWLSSSKNGGNCYISIVLKPENIEHLPELTQYTSLWVSKTLEEYGIKPTMKYPNDVLINGKKISGVLAESVFVGNTFKGVIVGIGVNLNLSADEIQQINIPATSLALEIGRSVDKKTFIENFLKNFQNNYEEFLLYGNKGEILC